MSRNLQVRLAVRRGRQRGRRWVAARGRHAIAFFSLAAVECAQPPRPREPAPPPLVERSNTSPPSESAGSAAVPSSVADAGATAAVPSAAPPGATSSFPPPGIVPPHPRSAHDGDGQWAPFEAPGVTHGALYKTVIHPHPESRFIALTVVAIDLRVLALHFMPGVEDVGKQAVPFDPGLVPEDRRGRLIAAFNGGFQPRHGRWGMKLGAVTIVPPRDIGCTLGVLPSGSITLATFSRVASQVDAFESFRQTPPCLVENEELHPDLVAGRDKIWGGRTPGLVTRRRSAVGIDDSGAILFYGIGVETTPKLLGEGLRHAGAAHVAELDINWNWTQFLLFGPDEGGKLRVAGSLVDGEHSTRIYVERASLRDFFYLVRR